ncbi:uncharacterized protein PHACADRAFT_192865 [Phanerochaete carnosa HHB-10118-sp]|uniref:Uncharacterized protein n=1 Tax=Phanerochaete carnosa (strain HHB-10118-sp) TaxID=650164 RepID=K5WF68_PHACS|nr:uncharacterized protein PHACADRAFT_192865 [Phanerochaete carnosa HHB-10118-sp]EKM57729.1 hypothetical protein PHACADRAFT_192865 [Phanerochaete carnosa HHB-10118-sp]
MSLNTRGTRLRPSNENVHTLLDGVVVALTIAKDATAAFPPLQSAVGGVASVVDVVKKMGANIDQIKLLEQHANQLSTALQNPIFKNEKACPEDLRWRIDTLERHESIRSASLAYSLPHRQLAESTKEIRKLASRSKISRFFRSDSHTGTINEHITKISRTIEAFLIGGIVNLEVGVNELLRRFDKVDTRLDENQAFIVPVSILPGATHGVETQSTSAFRLPREPVLNTSNLDGLQNHTPQADRLGPAASATWTEHGKP